VKQGVGQGRWRDLWPKAAALALHSSMQRIVDYSGKHARLHVIAFIQVCVASSDVDQTSPSCHLCYQMGCGKINTQARANCASSQCKSVLDKEAQLKNVPMPQHPDHCSCETCKRLKAALGAHTLDLHEVRQTPRLGRWSRAALAGLLRPA
jgi:hypothetical protein